MTHLVLNRLHASDATCDFDCLVDGGLGCDDTAKVDYTFESFYMDIEYFQGRSVQYRRFHLGSDDGVV